MVTPAVPLSQPAATPPPGERDLWPRPEDFPNVHELVIEDGKPVDNIFAEKQMRMLTEPLHSSWPGPGADQPFVAMANVGVFHTTGEPPIVPDALLALGVRQGDLRLRENRSYFVWLRGKVPDVAIEVVSNREGGEDTDKLRIYARIGVPYYVIYDPEEMLGRGVLRVYKLSGRTYQLLSEPYRFEELGLGVVRWPGRYEDMDATWLRWCDRDGQLIRTGAESAAQQQQRATQAEQRLADERQARERMQKELEQLKEKLRQLGVEPP
jgi:hypothetical protein